MIAAPGGQGLRARLGERHFQDRTIIGRGGVP
jgi:hypothetical protein